MSTPPAVNYPQPTPMTPEDQRLWSTLVHVGGLFFYFVAPLVGYLVFRDRGAFIRQHTATALNFQLTVVIGYIIGFALSLVFIGFILVMAVWVAAIVLSIVAAVEAHNGRPYRYPLAIAFVS